MKQCRGKKKNKKEKEKIRKQQAGWRVLMGIYYECMYITGNISDQYYSLYR